MTTLLSSIVILCCYFHAVSPLPTTSASSTGSCLWKILQGGDSSSQQLQQQQAFSKIFGPHGERGEYMDGYSPSAMMERCLQDYGWDDSSIDIQACRAEMMAHLYQNPKLYDFTSMICFAEHYVLSNDETIGKPLQTFLQQKSQQPETLPVFAGVVWEDWQELSPKKLERYRDYGIEYVRMHANLMDILRSNQQDTYFQSLAKACLLCQSNELVPVILLQVPWRVPDAQEYYEEAISALANALQDGKRCLLLETRAPIGISTQDETQMTPEERIQVGFQVGQQMVPCMKDIGFGFCVAGGSTKGILPPALQDDTQNAIRQGIRNASKEQRGYEFCYWEMGAKLMLQPQVGQLWWKGIVSSDGDKDAARLLFCENAKAMAEEIVAKL